MKPAFATFVYWSPICWHEIDTATSRPSSAPSRHSVCVPDVEAVGVASAGKEGLRRRATDQTISTTNAPSRKRSPVKRNGPIASRLRRCATNALPQIMAATSIRRFARRCWRVAVFKRRFPARQLVSRDPRRIGRVSLQTKR
jgi:hypothetical protein